MNWLTRLVIAVSAGMALLTALAILLLRYWLLPNVGQFQEQIAASLSDALGNTVTIGSSAGNWQGLRPHLKFTDVKIFDRQGQVAFVLPQISGSMSWMSLLSAELRLASLEIDRPELLVRRDVHGQIYVGGVALTQQGSGNDLADLLLHQPRMTVRDALIVWMDEQREAPPLVLQRVNLRMENRFSKHRFALRAVPPEALAGALDVRGDFRGASLDDTAAWRGQLFAQLGYTDMNAWRPWLDLPGKFGRGSGALRGWLDISDGRVAGITADLHLRDVLARLADDVPEMELLDLRGRVAWKDVAGGMEISTRHLALRLKNGVALQPTDFYFRSSADTGALRANLLQLESLTGLAGFLPLEAGLRAKLAAYAPRGKVSGLDAQWQGDMEAPEHFRIKGQFENLALRQAGALPGFSGLSLGVDGNETGGRLNIDARRTTVEAPGALREPLFFATLTGQAGWRRKGAEWLFKVDNLALVNDDLAGNLYGSYETLAGTPGVLDMTVKLTRGDVKRAARYTPLVALDREDNDWLNDAMLAGHTEDFRVRVKGNLGDFPLKGHADDALLEVGGYARGVAMQFDKDWPRIENIDGEFWIRGNKMEVIAPSATMLDARLQNVTVGIADLQSADLPLEIRGSAAGASATFLEFIQQSPVRGYIDGFTDGMSASGDGHLELFTHIPLQGDKPVKVSGTFSMLGNDIDLGAGAPLLRDTRGALLFGESGMHAKDVSAQILGGTASINVNTTAGGMVHATVRGHTDLDALRAAGAHPLLERLHGGAAWDADITAMKKAVQVVLRSDLRGISSSLPQPFAKDAGTALPLRLEKKAENDAQDIVSAQLGGLFNARLARHEENGAMVVRRGIVNFTGLGDYSQDHPLAWGVWPEKDGVWLSGALAELSLHGWGGVLGWTADAGDAFPVAGASLAIGKAKGFGMEIEALKVEAAKSGDGFAARLSSEALNGEVEWQPGGAGKLTARLQNLFVRSDAGAASAAGPNGHGEATPDDKTRHARFPLPNPPPQAGERANVSLREFHINQAQTGAPIIPGKLPALELAIEKFQLGNKQVGRIELAGHPDGDEWLMRRLSVVNPDGSLAGDGVWRGTNGDAQTHVNLLLQISDAGKVLTRSGYPHTVKGGSGKLAAGLSWAGAPDDFNYATLNGALKLDTGKGQFLKMDPGAGKLLSILSLQSLPRRITLDFTDVFSDGFQFDNINGNATIANGVIATQDLHIDGSSAKVTMKGSVNLNNETQDLRVRVLPTLGDSISLLGAFTAGPMVGLGSLLISKVLGNPLDKLVSFEYNISGAWNDPQVAKVGQAVIDRKEIESGK